MLFLPKKILFVSHNASRAGAPILLLNLAKAIIAAGNYKLDFLLRAGGELEEEFANAGNVILPYTKKKSAYEKINTRLFHKHYDPLKKINFSQYDIVVLNTITHSDLLITIKKKYRGKIICYIHELNAVINYLTSSESLAVLFSNTDILLTPCMSVKNLLTESYKVDAAKIRMLPYYIPSNKNEFLREEKQGKKTFLVGGCGTIELRKGTDLFIQLSQLFKIKYPGLSIKFVWKGGNKNCLEFELLQQDINNLDLDNIVFEESSSDTSAFYAQLDVFVLTSREDPYPLVMLEAANHSIPVICFENSGGAVEFVEGNGKIVPYLNLEKMSEAIHEYYNNPGEKYDDGYKAKNKLSRIHQNANEIARQFFAAIQ